MQFLYGDRMLLIQIADLFAAPADVIVNPSNIRLLHNEGLASRFLVLGGDIIQQESDQFINEYGSLESGMVAMTSAGDLPYQAILHAVGPVMGEGGEQVKVSRAVSNCLKLCNMHDWEAIAFPAICTGISNVPVEMVAQGYFRAITSFWDARDEGAPGKIMLCLSEENFEPFVLSFREASFMQDENISTPHSLPMNEDEDEVGIVDLGADEIFALNNNNEFDDWFK